MNIIVKGGSARERFARAIETLLSVLYVNGQ